MTVTRMIPIFFTLGVAGCAAVSASPIVTRTTDLRSHLGEVITIRGEVLNTKRLTILGVDVGEPSENGPELRGRTATATGKLEEYELKPQKPGEPVVAMPGPGLYLRLIDPTTGRVATAHEIKQNQN